MGNAIVILIVLALMGSVFWVMPSQADRKRMVLRQKAMRLGIKVRIPDKGIKERLIRQEDLILGSVIYERNHVARKKSLLSETFVVIKESANNEWRFIETRLPQNVQDIVGGILSNLKVLPSGAELVLLTPYGVSVFWNERGLEEDVDSLLDTMDKVCGAIAI